MEKISDKKKNIEKRSRVFLGVFVGILLIVIFISFGYLVDIVLGGE